MRKAVLIGVCLRPPIPANARETPQCSLGDEVLGQWVVTDDGVGSLLGVELEAFRDLNAYSSGSEELGDLGVVGQVRTSGIAPRVATTSILLTE